VKGENPAIYLPPGDPRGFAASEELIEKLAKVLIEEYAVRCNVRNQIIGIQLPPEPGSKEKNWISKKVAFLGDKALAKVLRRNDRCYGVSHSQFSNMLGLDVDNPELGDADAIAGALRAQGWRFKQFHTGRGRHFWIFFKPLPNELRARYGGGPEAIRALGEAFLALYFYAIQGRVELRGCGREQIKLPGQYDPFYRRVILPLDDSGDLIADFEQTVEYMCNIERNDSLHLARWIDWAWQAPHVRERVAEQVSQRDPTGYRKGRVDRSDLDDYLDRLRVRPGESHIEVPDLVYQCFLAGVPESEVLGIVEDFYRQGRDDHRVTCKDSLSQWRSKAKSHTKRIYSRYTRPRDIDRLLIYRSCLQWIESQAENETDRVFLALHLWASLVNPDQTYFLSRPKAVEWGREWGMTDGLYRGALKRYAQGDPIRTIKKGHRGRPDTIRRRMATEYGLTSPPEVAGGVLGEYDLQEFLELARNISVSSLSASIR
jgi:hypothetical protein